MDKEVVISGVFHVAITSSSSRHIKIHQGQIMRMLNLVMKVIYVLYIRLQLSTKLVKPQNQNWLKKRNTAFQLEVQKHVK